MAAFRQKRLLLNILPGLSFVFISACLWYALLRPAPRIQHDITATRKSGRPYGTAPFAASWSTWFQPYSWKDSTIARKGGKVDGDWNILYHLGGTGPWVQKIDGVVTNDISPPDGCRIEQVHMLSRHGERYPTKNAGARMTEVVQKLTSAAAQLRGDFAFVTNWKFFISDPDSEFEQLTSTGPFSGTLESFTTGVKLRTRYHHLLPKYKQTKLWSSDSRRVESTARYFASGFFGLPLEDSATIEVIPESPARGADTLTPSESCLNYREDELNGHEYGDMKLKEWQRVYLPPILHRFSKELGEDNNVTLSLENIYSMQEMCGYETTIRGKSPWCDLFTIDEWQSFEYARDMYHYYRSGPGNIYSRTMGTSWLNATSELLSLGPSAGSFFFSFSHDSDMIPTFSLLDLFSETSPLPSGQVMRSRRWKMSQVVPMGGRLIIERVSCDDATMGLNSHSTDFVRLNVNDGIIAIPECASGPGSSCPLKQFLHIISSKIEHTSDFRSLCGLPANAPAGITFLKQD